MRVLITGVEGFVGSHLAEYLLQQHVDVVGTRLSDGPDDPALRSGITVHTLDILHREQVRQILHTVSPDRIIHLAAQSFVPASVRDPITTFQVNVNGSLNILETVRELHDANAHTPHLLLVSTGEVYGKQRGQPVSEESPLRPANPYASSKVAADMIAQQYSRTFELPITVVRPFNHVGPGQAPSFVCSNFARQFAQILEGGQEPVLHVGNLEASRDFTDVRDVVRAYWKLFDRTTSDTVFNVCSGTSTTIGEVLSILMSVTGTHVTVKQDAERMRSYDTTKVVGDNSRLRAATGWAPQIPLKQSLTDLVAYWRSHLH
jgi:GDP-4-dehydro-6-deoxy-D-mannose reductase